MSEFSRDLDYDAMLDRLIEEQQSGPEDEAYNEGYDLGFQDGWAAAMAEVNEQVAATLWKVRNQ